MKKFTAIALISIALLSCKKETKTITKVDPVTGKTETIEVPVENTDNETAVVKKNAAIQDSLGVFTQKFKLEKGKTYPLTSYQKDIQTVTDPSGKKINGSSETTDEMSFTVNGFDKGIYDISINLISKRTTSSGNGKTLVIDTKGAAPENEQLKMMWLINKALTGNKLNLKMDENGVVKSITGFDDIYKKINTAVAPVIKDGKTRAQMLEGFKQSFNEKTLKEQFGKNIKLFPDKGAKIGESWTESENITPDGKVKLSTSFTLKKVDNGVAEIAVKGGIPRKANQQKQQGITRSVSLEGSQNGIIKIDANTGWILGSSLSIKTTQKETLSDGKQSESMTQNSTSTVTINPNFKL